MPIPLHNSIVHNGMIGIISIHIGTLAVCSHLFRYFFSNSGSYYIVFSHKSQKSACSASANGKTVVRQTSDRSQEIIRQWSSNRQAVVRQSVKKPMHNCWFCIRYLAKNTLSFWFKHQFDCPFHRLKGLKSLIKVKDYDFETFLYYFNFYDFLIPCLYTTVMFSKVDDTFCDSFSQRKLQEKFAKFCKWNCYIFSTSLLICPLSKDCIHFSCLLASFQSYTILAATFTKSAIIQFSVIIKVRSQHAVPVSVVRQWLHRHQTGVKKSSGSGQAIIRQWLGN